MPRNKGVGMPKKRKREAPKDKEEPESPLAPEEPEEALGSSPTSSTSPPTALATRAPVLAKLEESYEAAKLEMEVAQESMEDEDKQFQYAQRLHKAKMRRWAASVDNASGSPTGQIERYYQAELALVEAGHRHEAAMRLTAQAEAKAWQALVAMQAAEIKALRRLAPCAPAAPE